MGAKFRIVDLLPRLVRREIHLPLPRIIARSKMLSNSRTFSFHESDVKRRLDDSESIATGFRSGQTLVHR